MNTSKYETREQYLVAAARAMNAELLAKKCEHQMPEVWFVSVMEPAGKVIGRAWPASHDAHHMFVSAALSDPVQLLATLLHEMLHLAVGVKEKHNKVFGKAARAVGLKGKLTATTASDELVPYLKALDEQLGGYPHRPLMRLSNRGGHDNRIACRSINETGYKLLIARKWVDTHGYPKDPWGDEMVPIKGDQE